VASEGWVVARKLSELHVLRNKLVFIAEDELKTKQLPPMTANSTKLKSPTQSPGKAWSEEELHDAKVMSIIGNECN
jgi:hypothetical protein